MTTPTKQLTAKKLLAKSTKVSEPISYLRVNEVINSSVIEGAWRVRCAYGGKRTIVKASNIHTCECFCTVRLRGGETHIIQGTKPVLANILKLVKQ